MVEVVKQLLVSTELGQISVVSTVVAHDLVESAVSLRAVTFDPKLPADMSVRKCTAILLAIDGRPELERVSLSLTLQNELQGDPCTGQCLDAQEWSDGENLVVIGTEDGEALDIRYPKLGFYDSRIVSYAENSLTLQLNGLPKLNRPSYHFIIAENEDPEPVESSAWFAVDQNHQFLLNQ
ncbi:MAG: hypothetical protein GY807_02140 [Gammaproteobacteria bacterium]|nr:hypothetical protein [Gammaproteobacteria bacterium]